MQPLERKQRNQQVLDRILIIEDDPVFRRLYRHLLSARHRNYELVECSDGYTALGRMLERTPRLILLDLTMPRFDGAGFLAIVKSKPELSGLPIIVISSDAEETRARVGELENVRWFTKPMHLKTLEGLLEQELGKPGTTPTAPTHDPCAGDARIFDQTQLELCFGSNRPSQEAIAYQFCSLAAERLALLEAFTHQPDRAALRTLIHVLEGSASALGAPRLLAECKQLRIALDAHQDDEGISSQIIAVSRALQLFTVTLARHFELADF